MIPIRRRLIAAGLLPLLPGISLARTPACGAPTGPRTAGPFFRTDYADERGLYSSGKSYRYRGHQFTDAQGRFKLETVRAGESPGRTRRIHGSGI